MIYVFQCLGCGEEVELSMPAAQYETTKKSLFCQCGGQITQVLFPPKTIFNRTGFPRNFVHEHISDNPVKLRDKKHFMDVSQQNGWTPSWFDGI